VSLIELENVDKHYGAVHALRGLTATIDGKKIGLLGQNGAGKSTLIKVMLGLEPAHGKVRVLGLDPAKESFAIRERVGYMPEGEVVLPDMNAVEMCAYAAELSGLPRDAAMQRAHAALYYANLEDKRYQPVAGYSTGQKQRVKLATALVHDPELLFLDEPTNGLDPPAREEMLSLIDGLPARRGLSIILSTHLMPDVERVCDHVVMVHAGQLKLNSTLAEVRGEHEARLEVRAKDGHERLAAALRERGVGVEIGERDVEGRDRGLALTLPAGAGTRLVFEAALAAGVQVRHLVPLRSTLEARFIEVVREAQP
jgi:ABC-2 type transport system ATP-binding protein